ncbi:aminotransferase DegT [Sesbania bispinosa]|nr:aminotransferase DegT [Sesbania bispinosa]
MYSACLDITSFKLEWKIAYFAIGEAANERMELIESPVWEVGAIVNLEMLPPHVNFHRDMAVPDESSSPVLHGGRGMWEPDEGNYLFGCIFCSEESIDVIKFYTHSATMAGGCRSDGSFSVLYRSRHARNHGPVNCCRALHLISVNKSLDVRHNVF